MSFYEDRILPRCVDWLLSRKPFLEARERVARGLAGEVVEIGFGSGLNLPYLPRDVSRLYAIEPSGGARELAAERIAGSSTPVELRGLDGQSLPFPDASVDAVLSTFTLCTIPDYERALAEVRRVLKPGGRFHFLEHGRSPEASVAKWQDWLTPIQRRIAGGCQLNRPIDRAIEAAGLRIGAIERYYLAGPKFAAHLFEGRAF
ncbi:MAG: class I SAM-dependent methyltransferase [Candidatus Binatia bacterium]